MARILKFPSVPCLLQRVQEDIFISSMSVTMEDDQEMVKAKKNLGEKPNFGSRPNYGSPEFNFQKELYRLPFQLNLGKVEMSKEQQVRFLELIYDNQSEFLLCDEDLGLCDHLMKSGKPFLMGWFARYLIIIWIQPKCPTILNMKFRITLLRLMWPINL